VIDASLRTRPLGSTARAFDAATVRYLRLTGEAVEAKRLPIIALAAPVIGCLSDAQDRSAAREASRTVGPLCFAVLVFLVCDSRDPLHRKRMHDSVRALSDVGLDVFEDLFREAGQPGALVEAERLYRAHLLEGDWTLDLTGDVEDGRQVARVRASVRAGCEA
jgi:hypothetical protein